MQQMMYNMDIYKNRRSYKTIPAILIALVLFLSLPGLTGFSANDHYELSSSLTRILQTDYSQPVVMSNQTPPGQISFTVVVNAVCHNHRHINNILSHTLHARGCLIFKDNHREIIRILTQRFHNGKYKDISV